MAPRAAQPQRGAAPAGAPQRPALAEWQVVLAVAGPVLVLAAYLHQVLRPLVELVFGG